MKVFDCNTVGELKKLLSDFDDSDELVFFKNPDTNSEDSLEVTEIEHSAGGFHSECVIYLDDFFGNKEVK